MYKHAVGDLTDVDLRISGLNVNVGSCQCSNIKYTFSTHLGEIKRHYKCTWLVKTKDVLFLIDRFHVPTAISTVASVYCMLLKYVYQQASVIYLSPNSPKCFQSLCSCRLYWPFGSREPLSSRPSPRGIPSRTRIPTIWSTICWRSQ